MYQGIDVPVGKSTNIALSRIVTNKIERPYSNCVKDVTMSTYYKKLNHAGFIYRRWDCMDLCLSEFAFRECKCYEGSTKDFFTGPICKTLEEIRCLGDTLETFYLSVYSQCDCPLECNSISYSFSTSSAEFPTLSYLNLFTNLTNTTLNQIQLKMKLLQLNIYFDELRYTVIDELKKTDLVDLISSCGGIIFFFNFPHLYSCLFKLSDFV
jgi:hypothetical protein